MNLTFAQLKGMEKAKVLTMLPNGNRYYGYISNAAPAGGSMPILINCEISEAGVHSCLRVYDDSISKGQISVFLDPTPEQKRVYSYGTGEQ